LLERNELVFSVDVERGPDGHRHRLLIKATTTEDMRVHLNECEPCRLDIVMDLRKFADKIENCFLAGTAVVVSRNTRRRRIE
jgi:hypothetical protein